MAKFCLSLCLALLLGCASVPEPQVLPARADLRDYRLDNGLRVLLLPRSQAGVEMRLLVASGSLQETAQQRGLAHFVEHMAFKGSAHFPGQSALRALGELGIGLGPDINASTRFNSTLYKLSLPDSEPGRIDLGLRVIGDWAAHLSFDSEAFDAEREVIVEEWRMRQGLGQRINQRLERLRYQDSDYQERDPIGELSVIRQAPVAQAVAYYRQWYQPQRMSLVVVGQFDEAEVRMAIERIFAGMPRGDSPASEPGRFQGGGELRLMPAFDAEQGSRMLQFALQRDLPVTLDTQNGQWRDLIDALWLSVLDERLELLVEQGLLAGAGLNERATLLDARRAQQAFLLRPRDADYARAAGLLFGELRRLALHPVSEAELRAASRRLLDKLGQQAASQQRYEHQALADGLSTALEYRMPLLDKRQQLALSEAWLATIGPGHLQAAVAEWLAESSPRLALVGPDSDAGDYSATALERVWRERMGSDPGAFPLRAGASALELPAPLPGRLSALPALEPVGAEQWLLDNGIRLIFKADASLRDDVALELRQAGGLSLEEPEQAGAQRWAIQLAERSGYGDYRPRQLAHLAAQRRVSLQPYTESLFHGLRGTAPSDQLETLFKLVYLKLSAPRFEAERLEELRTQFALSLDKQPAERRFMDAINREAYDNGQRLVVDAQGAWRGFAVEELRRSHAELFRVGPGMTLVLAGSFDRNEALRLGRVWLGGLAATAPAAPGWRDRQVRPRHLAWQRDYPWASSPKSMLNILYSSPASWSAQALQALQVLDVVANQRLRQAVRDEASGVYAIGFSQLLARLPEPYYLGRLSFTAAPQRAEELSVLAQGVIGELAAHGISQAELRQARLVLLKQQDEQRRSALYWSQALAQTAWVDDDFAGLAEEPRRLRELDLEQVNSLARSLLGRNPKVFRLSPANGGDAQATGTTLAQ